MVMKKLLLNKVKTETKKWVRGARLHGALMQPDVRLGVWNSRGPRRGDRRMLDSSRRCGSTASCLECTTGPRARLRSSSAFAWASGLEAWAARTCHRSARGGLFCGQPVQNLCLSWAQHIGVATTETQVAFGAGIMVKVA